ncbi:hypothetical protein SSX86_023105 [Deinandra increscens subsp. villosa]|uniref:PGG domain-containing protein n=1 Tax=Deinandra increscens subsp. villosa TaxID=3103831 RepID=A0AAP0CQ32_9ASTR
MDRRLIHAAWNGDVEYLLNEIDKNPSNLHAMALEGGETPLHIACFTGHLEFAATVIKLRPGFTRELNQDGFSPLHIAAACGHVEIVKELLKVDIGLCLIKGINRRIPLHLAVIKGKTDVIIELLLSNSDSIECTTAQGDTSLHLAIKNSQFEAFQVLIQHVKQVNKEELMNFKDFNGNTIFHLAVSRKQFDVLDFLLNGLVISKEKMEMNSINKNGLTPLDILLMFQTDSGGDREIVEILIQTRSLTAENLHSPADTQPQRPNHDTTQGQHRSPAKKMLDYFKYNNLNDSPSKVRNTLLVIVILITAATYQSALSPPGGTWQDDYIPSKVTNNTTDTKKSKPHTAGESIMLTHNPVAYSIFLSANSLGFYTSLYMILVLTAAFPMRMELQILVFALSTTYSTSMNAIAPHSFITYGFIAVSIVLPFGIPVTTMLLRNYYYRSRNV